MSAEVRSAFVVELTRVYRSLAPDEAVMNFLDGLTEVSAPGAPFFEPGTRGGRPRINREHALMQRLLQHRDPEIARCFLVSSIFTLLHRARPEIDDEMERRFHARLLARLLELGDQKSPL